MFITTEPTIAVYRGGWINIPVCDWLWENPPVTHKDNYLEKHNRIIQSVISPEGLKLQACDLPHSYSYSRSIRLLSP